MKIALASPPYPKTIADGLYWTEKLVKDAAAQHAVIVCFPESYLPGYPGLGFVPEQAGQQKLKETLDKVCEIAKANSIAIIMPMDLYVDDVIYNVAQVISKEGELIGHQTKNQLDPSEDDIWAPGTKRQLFELDGLKFGITICHEGFRYPESVRWAAQNGAHIVFHPHLAGNDVEGSVPTEWGSMNNYYYEKAMMMRALENTIYFASCNYATKFPESASSIIAPDGDVLAHAAYTQVGVTVADIDLDQATGYLAKRFKNHLYDRAKDLV